MALIHRWPLVPSLNNNNPGKDIVGTFDLTVNGTITQTENRGGKAATTAACLSRTKAFSKINPLTLCGWIDSAGVNLVTDINTPFGFCDTNAYNFFAPVLWNGDYACGNYGGVYRTGETYVAADWPAETFTFLLYEWDPSTNTQKIYRNGLQVADYQAEITAIGVNFSIFDAGDYTWGYWDGYIKDVRIYNNLLSQEEKNNLYNLGPNSQNPSISAPLNLTTTVGDAKVTLAWDAVTGATGYNVKRSTSTGGPYTTISTVSINNHEDTGVVNGTTYYYVVTALNDSVESTNSNEVSATPIAAVKALLIITMSDQIQKEYELTQSEVNAFISWHESKVGGRYVFNKTFNLGPFQSRKDHLVFDKIQNFEVMEFTK